MINHNNRPQVSLPVAGSADKKIPVLKAHKKMLVLAASFLSVAAIAQSATEKLDLKLQKSALGSAPADVAGCDAVSSNVAGGLPAHGELALDVVPTSGSFVLEAGEVLYLDVNTTSATTLAYDGSLSLDLEIVGN